ncbi:uncharacterized protein LOC108677065 [Hyalella azteca]|uniref:Uncharacterized protein LOC108677065 n=1 Tax=Hyalella azteca TaxID=294128 RepID=A0A8B7P422_HYAAZ|nr:uncharacterized protein LOC108677065 [Hyalella azteca]
MEVYPSDEYITPMTDTTVGGDATAEPPQDPNEGQNFSQLGNSASKESELVNSTEENNFRFRHANDHVDETVEDEMKQQVSQNNDIVMPEKVVPSPLQESNQAVAETISNTSLVARFSEEPGDHLAHSPTARIEHNNDESHCTPQSHCESPQHPSNLQHDHDLHQDQPKVLVDSSVPQQGLQDNSSLSLLGSEECQPQENQSHSDQVMQNDLIHSQKMPSHQQMNLNQDEQASSMGNAFTPTNMQNPHSYTQDMAPHPTENSSPHSMFSDTLASLAGNTPAIAGNPSTCNEHLEMSDHHNHSLAHLNLPPPVLPNPGSMPSMISPSPTTNPLANAIRDYCDTLSNMRPQNCDPIPSQNSSYQDNGHCSTSSDMHQTHSRPNSVYDFDPSATGSNNLSMVNMDNNSMMNSQNQSQLQQALHHERQNQDVIGKSIFPMIPLDRCESFSSKRDDVLSHLNSINQMQQHNDQVNNGMNSALNTMSGNDSLNQSYDSSLSVSSSEFPNTATCYDPLLMRRGRGRPRGSKNGTGMGRGKSSYGRGSFRFNSADDRPCSAYDLRHIPDPFGTARRGRPRSRFIVDLGEQNHEAWTKARLDLNVSDAELTTLLLSLLESRRDLEDTADSDTMLGLINSEYSKWKDKFASQVSMLSHFASIHNTNCCTCLGIKKKKLTPVGTGKRGRPRKYPPPVGYGPGMQRPDTIDEDGNIFEPQCILKDGTIVKAEPHDEKPKMHNGEGGSDLSNPGSANGSMMNSMNSLPPRAMLTHEEMQKRREYYSNHKNKIKYVCHFCQVHFYHKPNFDYHISKLEREGKCRIYDKVNNLYLCESCGEGFSWREKLEKHLRLAEQHGTHNQKELLVYGDFQCSMCGKTFNKRNTYLQHIKWHEDREDVPCVICATLFKQTELRRHLMEVHNNDSLPCCYCGKLFTSRKYLEKHELIHQSGNFPCPECGKCFSQKMAMQHHLRSHSLDKEYSCETCGQMFTQRLGLCHHLRKQFGPGEFNEECSVCSTYFCNEYDLQIHKRKVHNMTEHMEELPPESYLPINMRNHMSPTDRNKHYSEANNMVKNMLGGSLGNNLDNSMSMTMKSESEEPMDDSQVPSRSIQHSGDPMRDPDRNSAMNDLMRNTQLRENLMRDNRDTLMRDSIMRDNLLRDNRDSIMRDEDMAGNMMRGNSLRDASGHNENPVRDNVFSRNEVMRNNLMRDEDMRSSAHRNGPMQDESMRSIGGRDDRIRDENMSDDPMRSDGIRDNNLRENLRDGLIRDNPLRELAMRSESSLREDPMRENIPLLMNEHMRHMVERRELDPEELRLNPSLHNMHHQSNEDQLHVPQDLTRMTSQSLLMNDNRNGNNGIPNPQQHMADMRPSEDSPSRLSDTPGAGSGSSHMSDQLGRMAVENFNRMTSTPGGYLAEHLRRMAENQSRSGMASVMSDTAAAMMSHYDDRDYSRIDNLRSMSRASPADPMARLGDNLSHMGVIRPAQTPSSTPQWPPHMQNHSPLDGMNQSPQSTQHTLYPLPFWPYDPSLRHYNH